MDKKLAGLLGAAAALTTMSLPRRRRRAGRNSLKLPAIATFSTRSERAATPKSRRSTSGPERRHPNRPGCDRAPSSPSPPSRRWRLCPRRDASPSSPPPPSSPPSPSRLLMRHKGIRSDALMYVSSPTNAASVRRFPAHYSSLKRRQKDCGAAKSNFLPKRPSRPKPSPSPNRTTTNPDEMFHKLRSRPRLRST